MPEPLTTNRLPFTFYRIPFFFICFLITAPCSWGQDYAGLQNLLIGFYSYQKAGLKDANPHNPFYTSSPWPHGNDNYNGTALDGGWYDAGDFVKFGLPLGFTVYCLLKGYDVFPRGYDDTYGSNGGGAADGIPDVLNQVKYATDYIMKAVVNQNTVIMDMGLASQDHQVFPESGYQNSQRIPNRTAIPANGADVPGLYAASLALMGIVYKQFDETYAAACIAKAGEAFAFGLQNRKISTAQQKYGTVLYTSRAWEDKMALGAVELYRATGEDIYLEWAKEFQQAVQSHYFVVGYGHVGDFSAFELYRQGVNALSRWTADCNLMLSRVAGSNASSLVQGAFISSDWGMAGNAGNAAFSAALAFMIKGDDDYRKFTFDQVHWVAGMPPFNKSYVLKYNGGPSQPHHRNDATLGGLQGAVLSGPSPDGSLDPDNPQNVGWSFSDDRNNYKNTEPAINYNAGIIGALAFIRDYQNPVPGLIRIKEALKAQYDPLDLNEQAQKITMILESATDWTIRLTGTNSAALKTYTGSGSAVSITWSGEADAGSFQPGETVTVVLVSDKIAEYHRALSTYSFFLKDVVKQAFKPTDVLLDNFNSGELTNTVGGMWLAFNDSLQGGSSYVSPAVLTAANSITSMGEGDTKGLKVRLVAGSGAPHPHAGIRTTFHASGSAVSVGSVASVAFDVKASNTGEKIRVEFEQAGITDGAYHGADVQLSTNLWLRVRIPITSFLQPDWRSTAQPLRRETQSGLRFTYYGENNVSFTLDNVHLEGMDIGGDVFITRKLREYEPVFFNIRLGRHTLDYDFIVPDVYGGDWNIELYDMVGKGFYRGTRSMDERSGAVSISGIDLQPGIYILSHTMNCGPHRFIKKIVIP